MHAPYRLAVIGAGNMGQAVIRGILAAKLMAAHELLAVDVEGGRLELARSSGCGVSADPAACHQATAILLAVKPQSFSALAAAVGSLRRPTVVISIMAGLPSIAIRRALGNQARVIRVMPNTPAQIRAGIGAIALGAGAAPGDEQLALDIFNALGRTVRVQESQMHAVTAVSGSGPAYVFLLAEAMEQAAIALGLAPDTARVLVQQTITGAGQLMQQSDQAPSILRQAVSSPGGTTEAAIRVMMDRRLPQTIVEALTAARDRGAELEALITDQ